MTETRLFLQLDNIQNIKPEAVEPGAVVLRDAAWANWRGNDPDALPGDVTWYPIPEGAVVSAQEENFEMALFEFDLGPFLRPAIDDHEDDILAAISKAAQKQIEQLARGA